MKFLRSKAEHLADHLREAIERGELVEPLPGIRAWSVKLGISRRTLQEALWILQRERLIFIGQQGIRLRQKPRAAVPRTTESARRVRLLFYGTDLPNLHYDMEWIEACSERLHLHGIQFTIEKCNAARLLAIASGEHKRNDLFFLLSLPSRYQNRFARAGKPSVLLGRPAPGVSLPFLTVDQSGAIRHGTQMLLRRGFKHLNLILQKPSSPLLQQDVGVFQTACAEWPRQPIIAESLLISLDAASLMDSVRRFASRVSGPRGIVVYAPVPVGLIMTALMHRGVEIGRQAEIVSVFHPLESVKLFPPPIHYPYPLNRLVKELTEIALHYFERGAVPAIRKTLVVEVVRPC